DSRYPAHESGAPAASWSVSESAPTGQSTGDTAGSRRESKFVLGSPVWQPSVGEKSVEIPSSSCSAAHRESRPSQLKIRIMVLLGDVRWNLMLL
ncbi:hypothetical protein A2U01_0076790, partial [Trifolium medium]|nr:hypothetical protein [Trifolium medium]